MPGKLIRPDSILLADLRCNRDVLYALEDNMQRRGGPFAKMRGEPNVVGVPTKWHPSMLEMAFFRDGDDVKGAIEHAFFVLRTHLYKGGTVAIPASGLGTGLAELPTRAPRIHAYIEGRIRQLEEIANTPTEESRRGG